MDIGISVNVTYRYSTKMVFMLLFRLIPLLCTGFHSKYMYMYIIKVSYTLFIKSNSKLYLPD